MYKGLSHNVRLALAQLNLTVGDIEGNTKKIIENIKKLASEGRISSFFRNLP